MSFLYADKSLEGPNMPIVTPNSPEGIERAKWDRPRSQGGMRPDSFEAYPKAMYRAGRPDQANVKIVASQTVRSEGEEDVAYGQGWRPTQEAAIALVHQTHTEHGKLAAERAFHEFRMSEQAQREAAAFEGETVQHVPVIPETPIRKRPGRPAKAKVVS